MFEFKLKSGGRDMTIYEIREDRGNQLVIDRLPGWSLTILDGVIHECHVDPYMFVCSACLTAILNSRTGSLKKTT